jgi:hypothetical protein
LENAGQLATSDSSLGERAESPGLWEVAAGYFRCGWSGKLPLDPWALSGGPVRWLPHPCPVS